MINKGFTLIETLVAIFILTIAIAGPLTIASRSLNSALIAKDQMTAQYLAQDAIEYIRYARDTNSLHGGNWLTGAGATLGGPGVDLTQCLTTTNANGCQFDTVARTTPTACASSNGCAIPLYYYNAGFGALQQLQNGPTFTRSVTIVNPFGLNDEAKITVTVNWTSIGNRKEQVQLSEDLFNWETP